MLSFLFNNLSVILLTGVIFICIIINVISEKEFNKKLTIGLFIYAAISGIFFYGYALSISEDNTIIASFRAMQAMYMAFGGKDSYSLVSSIPLFSNKIVLFLYWLMHISASYVVTSAILKTFGKKLLRHLRWVQNRKNELNIIYGISKETIELGSEIIKTKNENKQAIIYVSKDIEDKDVVKIYDLDAVYTTCLEDFKIENEKDNSKRFIKTLNLKKRNKIHIYCLSDSQDQNYEFAKDIKNILEIKQIEKEKAFITLIGDELYMGENLKSDKKHGYGQVFVINKSDLAARTLINTIHTWDNIDVKEGKATKDFNSLIIGFGETGKSVLKYIIMNACFYGSKSIIKVIGKDKKQDLMPYDLDDNDNYLFKDNYLTIDTEHIENTDARSRIIGEYIKDNISKLKYIVVATGNDKMNEEIFNMIYSTIYLINKDYLKNINLSICSKRGIIYVDKTVEDYNVKKVKLIALNNLNIAEIDKNAIKVNYTYSKKEKDEIDEWLDISYYNRMSSRAAADFLPFFKQIDNNELLGLNREDLYKNKILENLSITEHLRWSAFHYVMGYKLMSIETFKDRYDKKLPKYNKDENEKTHACLVPWEDLDKLKEIDGTDYKVKDTDNVLLAKKLKN